MSEKKAPIDWEAIEGLYRTGVLSIREIAKQHGISDAAIRKRAEKFGWQRDLSAQVAQQVRSELVRTQVRTPHTQEQVRTDVRTTVRTEPPTGPRAASRTEREIVDDAVATVVQVVRSHRQDISHGRDIVALLLGQLVDVAQSRDELEGIIDQETADDKTPQRRAHLMRAISIPAHAKVISDLSTAMKNLVALERQAFNISDIAAPSAIEEATDDELDRAIAMYAAKAGVKLVAIGEE